MTTEGLEQKAAINPGRHTPGQRFKGPSVVVVVVVASVVVVVFGVVDIGRAVTVDGRLVEPAAPFSVGLLTLRLMQHFPPLEQTAWVSMKSHR